MNERDFEKLKGPQTVVIDLPHNIKSRISWVSGFVQLGNDEIQTVTTCIFRYIKIDNCKFSNKATFYGASVRNPKDAFTPFGGYLPSLKNMFEANGMNVAFTWHDLRLALRRELERM